ncbi:hypothetical protein EKO23_15970 [Nocardioides guangzhouensis]|uniref:Uncharacterized protein n=1 Tax=Nocardioides guangzhouensis TaxID=2497878 RepID=A0A4Q4ZA18_9ACTN|nr:hypothetical protein [Nocardioides guangzhouensis]RYP84335.1 hypothetical protein EKO23_15970 [Nocardioides guangzhouensis]
MADTQRTDDLLSVLNRLVGESVAQLQVLGINSLKSVTPSPSDLVGSEITSVGAADRVVTVAMGTFAATVDLQRTGRLAWLDKAEPAQIGRPSLPTIRLLLRSGAGLDFIEPAKTKRIAVTLRAV